MIYTLPYVIMLLWCIGGQINKTARRFWMPAYTALVLISRYAARKDQKVSHFWFIIIFLLYVPILSIGYGVDSILRRWFRNELIIRLVYAILVALPLTIYAVLTHQWTKSFMFIPALVAAFQVEAKSLGKIGKYDILIEDIVRSLTLGYSIVYLTA